ncbi:MAG TPA: hypothetical protein PKI17_02485 [Syntrophomonas sp.]|nr:hypothetical protein [Syntrophomonas sp.]
METELFKTIAEASPWAALLLLTLWRFDVFNNRLISENRDREERMLTDSREREAKYGQCINRLEVCIEKVAENQRVLAEEVSRIREDIEEIKGDLKK